MRALVTGAAGFIGSHLVDRLIGRGHVVTAVDCFTSSYDPARKRSNLTGLVGHPRFTLAESDLRVCALEPMLDGVDVVFHLAGQSSARRSWADEFVAHDDHNVRATQRLLEAAAANQVKRLVYASSSSVYGNVMAYPTDEDQLPRPQSPYGVTKLAAELLCRVYAENYGVPTVSLRYFTVYGPRQRPDMAVHRMIACGLSEQPFQVYGDGTQVRDYTYVADVVAATIAAATRPLEPGAVLNVSGGTSVSLDDLIVVVADVIGRTIRVQRLPRQLGDVARTEGATDRARALLDWKPTVHLEEGIRAQATSQLRGWEPARGGGG